MPVTGKRFARKVENFICEMCGTEVMGTGYTDHCSNCLYGKHVDINPGDRAARCRGLMKPVSALFEKESYIITYKCLKCGKTKRVKAAADDNKDLLMQLLQR